MTEFAFDKITAEQALGLKFGDTVTFTGAPGRTVSVAYEAYDPLALTPGAARVHVTYEGRTVTFAIDIIQVAKSGGLVMADGSRLHIGDAGNDRVLATAGDDGMYGGPGNDTLNGGDGRDLLQGNAGDDVLAGGEGGDTLYGGQGSDVIYTSREAGGVASEAGDWAHGNMGDDFVFGGQGNDTLYGGQGDDEIEGGEGDDFISGDLGNDLLSGGLGWDTISGGLGDDTLGGGFGPSFLAGGVGDDLLTGQGPDGATMVGGEGNDTIVAGSAARDLILGEGGKDRFEIVVKTAPSVAIEAEIQGWESGDQIHFAAFSILGGSAILPRSYSEFEASDYATALKIANEHISAAGAIYVVAQVGADLYVFADTGDPEDGADVAILLSGASLTDISLTNFV